MVRNIILKLFLTTFTLVLYSTGALAIDDNEIVLDFTDSSMDITTQDVIKNTTFKRFNDIWIVFSKPNLKLDFNKQKMKDFGIKSFEKIIVKNGTGFRFRFNKVPSVNFVQDYIRRTNTITLNYKDKQSIDNDTIKFRTVDFQDNVNVKQMFLDSSYEFDYVYSLKTGEKYLIAISGDKRLHYPTKIVNNDLYFLPTYSGAVIISENGEYLNIIDESLLGLSSTEDKFFLKASKDFSAVSIDEFFFNNDIDLIEKQARDYSIFNRQMQQYKSKKEYAAALENINNALNIIENFDYLSNAKQSSGINYTSKIAPINIQEAQVFDMSGEGDGLFEEDEALKQQLEDELSLDESDEGQVLVPDFSSDNLPFLLEKLRLTSIKQTGLYNKEKITLKRMQINAYKSYFSEILDLTSMIRLDISGDFPKNNKGLALYALASAQLSRCEKVISLPEKSGSVYTQDLKLWKAYCLEKSGQYQAALSLFKLEADRIETYPIKLRNDLKLSYAVALRSTDNYKHSSAILDELEKKPTNNKFADSVKFYKALNYLYQNEPDLAEKEFKGLVFSDNLPIKYKARLEYLNILLQKDDQSKEEIINALEDLRFAFRGDNTELEATKVLASLYLQEDYIKKAMELYKYISIYFSNDDYAAEASETLFNIFSNLFGKNQVLNSNIDDISRLALFYDFIELTPSEYEGNKIISNVVADLIELGLYDNAIKLINIQLNYKTEDPKIAEHLGEILAGLYLKTGQLDNALDTLKITQRFEKDTDYTINAKLVKAKVLILQEKETQAEELLKSMTNESLQAKYILAELYWNYDNYKGIINTLEDVFLKQEIALNEDAIINLSYLMLAYALNAETDKLLQIKSLYIEELEKVDLATKVDFLLKLAGEDVRISKEDSDLLDVWKKVIAIDNELEEFSDNYNKEVEYREILYHNNNDNE